MIVSNKITYLTKQQVADLFNVHFTTVDRWTSKGKRVSGSRRRIKLKKEADRNRFPIKAIADFALEIGRKELVQ